MFADLSIWVNFVSVKPYSYQVTLGINWYFGVYFIEYI